MTLLRGMVLVGVLVVVDAKRYCVRRDCEEGDERNSWLRGTFVWIRWRREAVRIPRRAIALISLGLRSQKAHNNVQNQRRNYSNKSPRAGYISVTSGNLGRARAQSVASLAIINE